MAAFWRNHLYSTQIWHYHALHVREQCENARQISRECFGARQIQCSKRPDGRIANAQVRIGTSTVMVSEAQGQYRPSQVAYYLYVENVDQVMQQALAAGGELEMEVADRLHGDR